ncbi:glucosaminidase domain-containing protein [Idiomarina tyrosinivorans]|nr:glucosaminidase domain-containing protein [Idiomarina tyrosinivorans]
MQKASKTSYFMGAVIVIATVLALLTPWLLRQPEPEVSSSLPPVPDVEIHTEVPDFTNYQDVKKKKAAFFEFLLPAVHAENLRILHQRERLLNLYQRWQQGETLSNDDQQWLQKMAEVYELSDETINDDLFTLLRRRIDIIPEMLVLVQAANESGWGTSRFATEGLNFFGQWCYKKGCGLIPSSRDDDGRHEVAKFDSVNASIRSYMRNINSHPAYLELRLIREEQRLDGEPVTAVKLIEGLHSYSEKGQHYIDILDDMIRVNRPIVKEINAAP